MKKSVVILAVLCLLLSGCSGWTSGNTGQPDTTGQTNQATPTPVVQATPTITVVEKVPAIQESPTDASVEALVALGESYLDALFSGDTQEALDYCDEAFKEKMEKDLKTYIGTKTNYTITKIDTTIKPEKDNKYILQAIVSAENKTDKTKKPMFKYELTATKSKGDYFVVGYVNKN